MKKSLSQQAADQLYTMIVIEKAFKPGEKLPNELELAQSLGISRTTLREALHSLTSQGLLSVQRGRGTFVSENAGKVNDFGFSRLDRTKGQLRDLFELRQIFEPTAARLACLRATPGELEDILSLGATVERCIQMGADRTQADRAFHAAIVRATHNEFMMRLLPLINQAVEAAVLTGEHREQLAEDTRRDHALLIEFLKQRDANGAEHAMAIHIHRSIHVMGLDK